MFGIEFLQGLVYAFGYFGAFFSAFLGSAMIIIPTPALLVVFFAGSILNPLAIGIVSGFGAAIGELIGYGIGIGGNKFFGEKKNKDKKRLKKWIKKSKNWFKSYGGFFLTFIFAVTPLPDDIIGIIAGYLKYDIKKYFFACLLGKIILCTFVAYAGHYGIDFVLNYVL
ncbi:MAG: VTT domain-containing protein [Candidatus Aenigmatarchaeota archaeon]